MIIFLLNVYLVLLFLLVWLKIVPFNLFWKTSPFVVRLALDDAALAHKLPAGSAGTAAIFTEHVKGSHIIRQVLLRQEAIVNYVWPY